ncbi:MAG: Diacetylchitobiose deacetylase [Methanomethylovorans sp. PtaU1.Bin093]|jgi:LmbE family N-acetylglucosaminyl deacetylase|uniref:PIG-L deacetylase family protein n=1 Tax=Methanomethylovorans sp. PtaU1.Bin093 TaxID=1811679 RepID=UPI0009C51E4E|nr:PIG-L deacetylase family protein [Methanomethylovorans sp. PtaU1.Bin093]OPY18526.1 MAG: Diacetylchitobiose deacetylase [Methanomethylovorans sp. PtaU1.Bin093]
MNRKILAIGAHPDDIELGCGATLIKHASENDELFLIIASYGEKGGNKDQRLKEATESARLLGAKDIIFLGLPDTQMHHDGITVGKIDQYMCKIKPDIVYVHCPKDYHQDHVAIALSTLSASRHMRNAVLFYESPSTTIEFRPTAYNDVTQQFCYKLKSIDIFKSQKERDYMEKVSVIGLAKSRGSILGVKYAEAFEVALLFKW